MGLDMYLEKETYVKRWDFQKPEEQYEVRVFKDGNPVAEIKPERIKAVIEELGYWRKANAIHNWFVQNVQGGRDECQRSYVEPEQLQELLNTVNKVLDEPSLASELLPPASGFFFGSTDIDEGYWASLQYTKDILTKALQEPEESEFYYQASW